MRKGFDESVARRRIELLLNEARCQNPCADQTIGMAMRVVSNFYSCGGDVSSAEAKQKCRRISEDALALRQSGDPEWKSKTVNEHQEPLAVVWQWILRHKDTLTVDDVAARFRAWPMVTVTLAEDQRLRDELKKRDKSAPYDPIQRYNDAKIKVVDLDALGAR